MAVAKGTGSRQLLHPLPYSPGRPAGDRLLGSELQADPDVQFCWDWSLTQTRGPVHTECTLFSLCKCLKHTVKLTGFKKESDTQEVSMALYLCLISLSVMGQKNVFASA